MIPDFPTDWELPLRTDIRILGNKIYIPGNNSHTMVTIDQFTELVVILGLKCDIKLNKNPRVVVNLSQKTLSNFKIDVANICQMSDISLNLRLRMQQGLASIEKFWDKFKAIMTFYGQKQRFLSLEQCMGSKGLSLKAIILLPNPTFEVCLNQMLAVTSSTDTSRSRRDISLLSKIIGDGTEMIKIEHSLSNAIATFNDDFQRVEAFNHQMKNSIHLMDEELFTILKSEGQIREHLTDLEIGIVDVKNKLEYVLIKFQHLEAINTMLEETRLPDYLSLLQRAAFHSNSCQLGSSELEIHSTTKNDSVFIHRTLVELTPVEKYIIRCRAISPFKVSTWHNTVATKTTFNSFLINTTLVSEADLGNATTANAQLRTLKESEHLLGVFNIFGGYLQCLKNVEFYLNDELMVCEAMDVFPLSDDYSIKYNNRKISDHKVVKRGQKLGNEWMGDYTFMNVNTDNEMNDDDLVSVVHPVIDEFLFTPAGDIEIGNAAILTGGTVLFGICCCGICCCLCPPCRQCILAICSGMCSCLYKKVTSKTYRLKKENKEMRNENEQSRKSLEESVKEYTLVRKALQLLGIDAEDTDFTNVVNGADQEKQQNEGSRRLRHKVDEKQTQSQHKHVTFSAKDQEAIIHVDEQKGEKQKIKSKKERSHVDP